MRIGPQIWRILTCLFGNNFLGPSRKRGFFFKTKRKKKVTIGRTPRSCTHVHVTMLHIDGFTKMAHARIGMASCCKYYDILLWICGSAKVKNLARGIEFELDVRICGFPPDSRGKSRISFGFYRISSGFEDFGFPQIPDSRIDLKARISRIPSGFPRISADFLDFSGSRISSRPDF